MVLILSDVTVGKKTNLCYNISKNEYYVFSSKN